MRLTYISAEKFTNEVISSIRFERMAAFRDRFRNMDVLMVDDIQFIATLNARRKNFSTPSTRSTTSRSRS